MKRILIVNDTADMGVSYAPFFEHFGKVTNDIQSINEVNLVVFTGGSDVSPYLYGENKYKECYCDPERDLIEIDLFKKAKGIIPMFGICRGAQFLCVMTGGKLIQHVSGHHWFHAIQLIDGRKFGTHGSHHQMMIPDQKSIVLGWADPPRSQYYFDGNGEQHNYNKEVEVVEFPSIKAFGVQYHPEVMDEDTECFKYSQELVGRLL